jgi:hypothetical protein
VIDEKTSDPLWPTTLADRPELMREMWVHAGQQHAEFDPSCGATQVFAPCCGRKTAAFTVVSLHGLTTVIRGGNHLPPQDHDWACDGCLHLLILDNSNGWTWSKLYRALGAPADIIRHYRAEELMLAAEKKAHADDGARAPHLRVGVNPQLEYEKAHASLPAGVREIPGTDRPDV